MAEKLAVIDLPAKIPTHVPKTWRSINLVSISTKELKLIAVTAETAPLSSAFPSRRVLRGRARDWGGSAIAAS